MHFDFDEKKVEQSEELHLPEGRHNFYVVAAEEHESKAGNLSIKVKLKIKNKYTYIFLSPKAPWIAKSFLLSIGRKDLIDLNKIDPEEIVEHKGEAEFLYEENKMHGPLLKISEYYPKDLLNQENSDEIPF